MEKKSSYYCNDGRGYDVTMSWNEKFKDADKIFSIAFKAIDKKNGKSLTLPREIATYAIGDPEETLGERVKFFHHGDRDEMIQEYVTTAFRRVSDYIERGK